MGKVYEAMKKAERERSDWASSDDGPVNQSAASPARQEFDFLSYSLKAATTPEIERAKKEVTRAAVARQTGAQPAREVTVSIGRIDPHLVAFYDFDPNSSDQYNKLAIGMISAAAERPFKRVLIASAEHGDGRTSVMLNLACALARARQRVLVVESDLYHPSILRLLGMDCDIGIAEAVAKGQPAGAAAIRVQPYGFDLLPTRERVENAAELLASPVFREMLQALDSEYDFILFDSSPLLATADANLLLRMTDATLLVVRSGKTSSAQIGKAIAPLSQENILGVVLNRVA